MAEVNEPRERAAKILLSEAPTASCSRPASEYSMRHAKPAKDAGARSDIEAIRHRIKRLHELGPNHARFKLGDMDCETLLAAYEKLERENVALVSKLANKHVVVYRENARLERELAEMRAISEKHYLSALARTAEAGEHYENLSQVRAELAEAKAHGKLWNERAILIGDKYDTLNDKSAALIKFIHNARYLMKEHSEQAKAIVEKYGELIE